MSEMLDRKTADKKNLDKRNDKKNTDKKISDKNMTKEEYKRQLELKQKKQNRKDLFTVLAILSSVFVHAVLIVLLKGGEKMIYNFTGGSVSEAREIYNNTKNVLMGIGIISLVIMIVFIIQCVREHKKNKRMKEERKAFIDYDRLEIARVRVARARLEAQKNGDKSFKDDEFIENQRYKRYQGMSEAEYRKLRQEEYEKYLSMDFADDEKNSMLEEWEKLESEYNDEYKEYTRFERLKLFISEHILIIGIVAGVAIIAIMAAVIIGMMI